ncbi:MAG: response regulator [Myxococcaceae bacterium]
MEKHYTTHDISELLQVDPSTVAKWVDRGLLTAFRTPGGHRRVRSGDLRAFLVAHEMPIPGALGSTLLSLVVVESDKQALETLRRALRPYAAQVAVHATTSGVEGLLLTAETQPHGLLLDLDMPSFDALEACRRVRSRKNLEGVRVVTLTTRPSPGLTEQSERAGALACLTKPVETEPLLELFRVPLRLAVRKG